MTEDNGDSPFIRELRKLVSELGPPEPFEPHAWHNADGDSLEIVLAQGERFGKYLNEHLYLEVDRQDQSKILGVRVTGLSKILEDEEP